MVAYGKEHAMSKKVILVILALLLMLTLLPLTTLLGR